MVWQPRRRLAIFGAGRMGAVHASNIAQHSGAVLKAIVDPQQEAAHDLAERYGAVAATAEAVFADPDIEAIVIASAAATHPPLIEMAIGSGKAVLCEKPLARDLETVRPLVERIEAAGTPFLLAFNRRFDPGFLALAEALRTGKAGKPELLLLTSRDPAPPPLDYVVEAGGILRETTIHDIDMVRWLTGEEPVSVHALGAAQTDARIAQIGQIDTVLMTLVMPSGLLVSINNSWRSTFGYDQRAEIHGSKGTLHLGNVPSDTLAIWNGEGALAARPHPFFLERYCEAYRRELDYFLASLSDGHRVTPSAGDGLRALEIAEAAEHSLRTGLPVPL